MNNPRLKTIELQGFKTFCNKVSFEFPLPITAIVGPNGSGKSNIADSIRWILGEQSFSLLRGRKTIDMIFSGSDQKARAGMASATIQFDNEDHWLPIDFETVSITRRATRDGQNEYFINGQKVRLKDVNELLSQSGLSERTYTIIGQGLIDNALSAKPDDRRKFFEEAAGIGLFRSRREEAIQRLTDTARNMERITDILSELEPRVKSLERQAKRAEEYDKLKTELQDLLRDWYGFHWYRQQQELLLAKERNKTQEEISADIRNSNHLLEEKASAIQAEVNQSREKLSALYNRSSEINRLLEVNTRNAAVMDERFTAFAEQIRNFSDDLSQLSDEKTGLTDQKSAALSELDELQNQAAEAQEQKEHFEAELFDKQESLRKHRQILSDKRNALSKVETNLIQVRAHHDEAQSRFQMMEDSSASLEKNLPKLTNELDSLIRQKNEQSAAYEALTLSAGQIEQREQELTSQSRETERKRTELSKKITDESASLARSTARLDVLQDAEQNLSGLNQGAQFLLKTAKSGRIKSAIQSLQSLLIVPSQYEGAVAAALGDQIDALLFEKESWGTIMDLLCSGNNGRAVLISESFQPKNETEPKNESLNGLRSIASLIDCDPSVRTLADRVLKNTFFAHSRGEALRLQPELFPAQSLVTEQGDIFRANGSVVSGKEGRQQILSRGRERRELESEIADQKALAASFEAEFQVIEKEISALTELRAAAVKEKQNVQTNVNSAAKQLNQVKIEIEKASQTLDFQKQRIADNEKQKASILVQTTADEKAIAQLEAQRETSQKEIRDAQQLIHQIQLDDLQNQVHHWSVSMAVIEKSISNTNQRIKELNTQITRNEQKSKANSDRIAALTAQQTEISRQKETLQKETVELRKKEAALEAEIDPADIIAKECEKRLTDAQSEFQAFQQRAANAERNLAQTQLEVTRQSDKLESLQKKIEDDFGLVAFTYKGQISGQNALPLGEIVSNLPQKVEIDETLENQIQQCKNHMRRLGAINTDAILEYKETNDRYCFLKTQLEDLKKADSDLRQVIKELDEMMKNSFQKTFDQVQQEFKVMFNRLFGGGSAHLLLTDPEDINNSGIEIEAKLPRHREQELSLLSGGERSLTSVALVFALLRVSPTPFCVLDEVDAALDEANVGRFCDLLKELSQNTQFLVITHNRNTVEASDVIYGITMGADSTSQVVSLKFDEVSNDILK